MIKKNRNWRNAHKLSNKNEYTNIYTTEIQIVLYLNFKKLFSSLLFTKNFLTL